MIIKLEREELQAIDLHSVSLQDVKYIQKTNIKSIEKSQDYQTEQSSDAEFSRKVSEESASTGTVEEPDIMACINCYNKADGFCIGCPGKRFCRRCFGLEHPRKNDLHRFFAYDDQKKQANSPNLRRRITLTKNLNRYVNELDF